MEQKQNLQKALAYSLVAFLISLMVLALTYHRFQSIQFSANTAASNRATLKIIPRPPTEASFWKYLQRYFGF